MAASWSERLIESLPVANASYHRLILAVGPARSGKTAALNELSAARGWPRINVNLRLAEPLIDLTQKLRAVRVAGLLEDLVRETPAEVVLLDNIEILFAEELSQDPLRLVQNLSRNQTIVVAWPGEFDGQSLTYAEPGHPEFRRYSTPEAVVARAVDTAPSGMSSAPEESE